MLRAIVLVLLLANAGFWAWRQGWLAPLHGVIGARPEGEREPERQARQLNPERVRVIAPEVVSAPAAGTAPPVREAEPSAAAAAPTACLEAGPYGATDLAAAETAVKALLPGGSWAVRELPSNWWVAIGPFGEAEQLQKKRDELRRRSIAFEQTRLSPEGAPLLLISRHDSRAVAEQELAALSVRGVRTARVVGSAAPQRALRVAQASAEQQAVLSALPPERLRGKAFGPCAASTL